MFKILPSPALRRPAIACVDVYVFGMLTILWLWSFGSITQNSWSLFIAFANPLSALIFLALGYWESNSTSNLSRFVHRFAIIPLVYFMYQEVMVFLPYLNRPDYDLMFISWDRILLGGHDISQLMYSVSSPALTEYFQIVYYCFFYLQILHSVEWWLRGNDSNVRFVGRTITFSFFLSYLAYVFFPAIGPRFTLHDFNFNDLELPGIWLTQTFREFINNGGGIIAGVDPRLTVHRDCFPSGHTWITVMNIVLSFQLGSKFRWFFLVVGGSLIFATLYLRYHYLVDVLAGMVGCLICLHVEPHISRFLRKRIDKIFPEGEEW